MKTSTMRYVPVALVAAVLGACSGGGGGGSASDDVADIIDSSDDVDEIELRLVNESTDLEVEEGELPDQIGDLDLVVQIAREQNLIIGGEIRLGLSTRYEDDSLPQVIFRTFNTVYATLTPISDEATSTTRYMATRAGGFTVQDLSITTPDDLDPDLTYVLNLVVGDDEGRISDTETFVMSAVPPLTTDLTIRTSWDTDTDLDVRLLEPEAGFIPHNEIVGTVISVSNQTSDAGATMIGGLFNADSNSNCQIDGRNEETIIYEAVTPPAGIYTFTVEYATDCGPGPTDYTVVLENGGEISTFTGTLEQQGDVSQVITFTRD